LLQTMPFNIVSQLCGRTCYKTWASIKMLLFLGTGKTNNNNKGKKKKNQSYDYCQ